MTDAQRVRQAQREIILLTIILLTTELEPENEGAGEKTERLRDACTEKTYERMYRRTKDLTDKETDARIK